MDRRSSQYLYNTVDCNISASSGEGFCIPILQGMACELPMIGPRFSSFVELVEKEVKGENGETIGSRGILSKKDMNN